VISAQIEEELVELSAEDAAEFLGDMGVTDSGVTDLIQAVYHLLGLPPISPPASKRPAHGPSSRVTRPPLPRVSSTETSSADSSPPRSSTMMTSSHSEAKPPDAMPENSASKVRNTSSKTAMSSSSASTFRSPYSAIRRGFPPRCFSTHGRQLWTRWPTGTPRSSLSCCTIATRCNCGSVRSSKSLTIPGN